ncbi:MAG: hypothetical protein IK081_01165 [Lachnospiraceae bacterium]|nr:hypothetical protein [Lachnospiraceae bacterium]
MWKALNLPWSLARDEKNDAKPERTGVMESGKCDVSLALTMIEVSA